MITLTDDQNNAIKKAKEWYLTNSIKPFVIMGTAGTGKSTIIKYLIDELGIADKSVRYVTFTGKAAAVLNKKGNNATTIHRLIYDPIPTTDKDGKEIVVFEKKSSIDEDIELIVVDEFFMVSEEIMKDLLSYKKKIIALGDHNQLSPPFGKVNDLYKNPDVILDKPLRQSLDNPIIYIADLARRGERIRYGSYGSVLVVNKDSLLLDYLSDADQIICGKNFTVKKMNKFYRKYINKTTAQYPQKGEKLICLRNNWDLLCSENGLDINLINGLTGYLESDYNDIIQTIDATKISFRPDFFKDHEFKNILADNLYFKYDYNKEDELYANSNKYPGVIKQRQKFKESTFTTINKFTYGYAITCHKSQGSEWENVTYIHEYMGKEINSKLLYTGITRASENLILVM